MGLGGTRPLVVKVLTDKKLTIKLFDFVHYN